VSGSLVRRVLENHDIRAPSLKSPARVIRYVFSRLNTHRYSPDKRAWTVSAKHFLAKGGTDGLAMGLELAVDSREAAPWQGAR
jgi:hypothetical protein